MPPLACRDLLNLHLAILLLFSLLCEAVNAERPRKGAKKASYTAGEAIPVSCLNRTV